MVVILGLFLSVLLHASFGANILVFQAVSMKSHLYSLASVLEELAPYHNITFYIGEGLMYKYPNITTKKIVSLNAKDALLKHEVLTKPCELNPYDAYLKLVLHSRENHYSSVYEAEDITDLRNSNKKFDLIIISGYVTDQFFVFVHKFNAPVIQISPSIMLPWARNNVGSPQYWESETSFIVADKADSFIGRFKLYVKTAIAWYRYYFIVLPSIDRVASKYFPPGMPTSEELSSRVELTFISTHAAMGMGKPLVPNIVEIAGLHIKEPKALPKELKEFMDSAKDGIVYFSLGSVMPESTMSEDVRNAMINTFKKLKQKVLWKVDGNRTALDGNIYMSNWFPQHTILNHPNVKLFIMQGGMLSLTESLYFGIPVLIMPIIFDQITNAHIAEDKGYGSKLDFCEFTEEKFGQKVNELLNNPKYGDKAKQISRVMRNDMPAMRKNVHFWIDFVLQTRNNSILKDMRNTKPFIQTMPADIFIAIALILLFIIISFIFIVKMLYIYFPTKFVKGVNIIMRKNSTKQKGE